jgi:hypothetical protein
MRHEGISLIDWRWSTSLVGVTLVGHPLGGLIGETWLDNEFRASNDTDTDFHIDEVSYWWVAGLSMKREGVDPNYWVVPARTKNEPILLTWDFSSPAPKVLGAECTIVISAHRGDERGKLTVKYVLTR